MASKQKNSASNSLQGLVVIGTVEERTRRLVPYNNPTTEIVTYHLVDNASKKYYVDDYAPDSYFDIGDFITVPVYVKSYQRKNGGLSYTLNIQKGDVAFSKGEHF